MNIDLIVSADVIDKKKIKGKSVVVIDMLRATSVIVTAIKNGCREVIPVLTIDEALSLAQKYKDIILGGERNAVKIKGFHCSNSPLEYKEDVVKGKRLVITTSNGTRAIRGASDGDNIFIGSMLNGKAVAHRLKEVGQDVVIINAGTNGEFSIDDFICSGYIISCLKECLEGNIELTDIASTAYHIYSSHTDIISFIKYAKHYKTITDLGLKEDLEYCCSKDVTDVVPEYIDGIIKADIIS
ncbi:putative 2-phosphosulfolactate phosphatase [Clostridium tepidiprofundi DSM 19306]|uniref:Probable 2-phosphosulfolactate phosphatase n=1 Tax=Clostridium tepidiprofundi DSM 19306 TaxID=1121338 RepID=A0A151B371_9CLOT|nr:2-phosphosulfolactate phosphatase family protein [Clostridium tepidiprofundi]KYH34346.1 putative 2-phosphosulfolactate phosphatase [Clostridium tepidiprofundi DSM 19306]